jgi:hypothetical protein
MCCQSGVLEGESGMRRDEISTHCLCDKCDGSECNIYSEDELKAQKKEEVNRIASAILKDFSEWCKSRFVDQQIKDFRVYKEISE